MKFPPMFIHDYLLPETRDRGLPAFVLDDGSVRTFGDVVDSAETIRSELAEHGVEAGDRVFVRSEPCPEAIETFLACSMAGAVYVPIDPEAPPSRLDRLLEVAEPRVVVTQTARQGEDGRRLSFETHAGGDRRATRRPRLDTDLAYIIFTSGTTGSPKGISMSHRAVVAFWDGMADAVTLPAGSIVGSTSPLHFDMSLLDLGLAWAQEMPVVQLDRRNLALPRRFVSELTRSRVTHLNCVPSVWRLILRYAEGSVPDLIHLRGTLFAGEPFPIDDVRRLRRLLPDLRLINCFGQSESIACSFLELPEDLGDGDSLPIGPAHEGAHMELIGADGSPCDPGEEGEIYLVGRTLFSGYWRDPEATDRALVTLPGSGGDPQRAFRTGDLAVLGEDGNLYFSGRRDHQVKVRGNRVELEEVERCLERHPDVVEAGVFVRATDHREWLAGAVVIRDPHASSDWAGQLRAFVAERLPEYMVPRDLTTVDELPRNTAGKLDRLSLTIAAVG